MSLVRTTNLAVLSLAAAAAAGSGLAQQGTAPEQGGLLEEIVVTAQRREEKIQDVPIAISAFNNSQLEQLGVTETLGLSKLIPNLLAFNNTGLGTANGYYLRGIGNTESIATFDPPVGTYTDDVFIARQNANNLGLFDTDRIEVLRGPQGTLFGRNTTGGAINIILKKPAKEFGGYAEVGFGQFNAKTVRASVDLPVSDNFLTKFSGFYVKNDGYVSNPVTGEDDLNAKDSLGIRIAARWIASEDVTWDLSVQHMKDNGLNIMNFASGSGGQAYRNGVVAANNLVPISATGPQITLVPQRAGLLPTSTTAQSIEARCSGTITRSRFACTGLRSTGTPLAGIVTGAKQNFNLGAEVKNTLFTSNVEWTNSLGAVNFITGYVDLKQQYAIDFFNGTVLHNAAITSQASNPAGGFVIANDGRHKQFSQEVKLTGDLNDRTRYVAGLYYFDEKNDTDFADIFGVGPSSATGTLVLADRILHNKASAWALYSQWDLKLADAMTVTLGGRYTDETKKVDFVANANPRVTTAAASLVTSANLVANGIPLTLNTKLFTPRLAVKYDFTDDVNVFASATRGFKSGGWNARSTSAVANQPFKPEKEWSYEAGIRSEWLDRKLRVNFTAFLLDVQDLQTPAAFTAPSGAISFITRNFAGLKNTGFEAEIVYSPTRDLNLFAFIGQQTAKYKNISPAIVQQQAECKSFIAGTVGPAFTANKCGNGIVNLSGDIAEPVRTPDTMTLGGSYSFHLPANLTLTPNIAWAHTGDNNVGTNGAPSGLIDAYATVDAGVTLANEDAGWQVQATCRNCTDEIQVVSVLSDLTYIQDPRTWMLTFKYNFGARR